MLEFLYKLHYVPAFILFLLENTFIVLGVVGLGYLLRKGKASKSRISAAELRLCIISTLINTGITFLGFILWQKNIIQFTTDVSWRIVIDFIVLFMVMDLCMYLLHLLIHHTIFYKPVHALHHKYSEPSPIDLFVLSPFEAFAFGSLWLILIYFYTSNFFGMMIYLAVNVVFGMIGHLSSEPFPKAWIKTPVLNLLCTSTFHYMHHQNKNCNFGFYTTIWDKIGRTLAPDYTEQFLRNKEK